MLQIQSDLDYLESTIGKHLDEKGRKEALQSLKNIQAITSIFKDGYDRLNSIRSLFYGEPNVPAGVDVVKKDPDEMKLRILNARLNTKPDPKDQKRKRGLKKYKTRKCS